MLAPGLAATGNAPPADKGKDKDKKDKDRKHGKDKDD
jgi:hypothetical protein